MKTGIDAITFDVAKIHLPIHTLAKVRNIEPEKKEICDNKFGFLAYGSGSKSKVFEGIIQPQWKNTVTNVLLFETLEKSFEIDFETHEKLHKNEQKQSV